MKYCSIIKTELLPTGMSLALGLELPFSREN
jgi:hypothetical protein